MTEREALKLALEAFDDRSSLMKWQAARDAVKEALAQPEQEPVAWLHRQGNFTEACMNRLHDDEIDRGWTEEPLYTTPPQGIYYTPPQRTWVGLTHSDIDQGLLRSDYAFKTAEAWRAGVVFAMTKLKEKNT